MNIQVHHQALLQRFRIPIAAALVFGFAIIPPTPPWFETAFVQFIMPLTISLFIWFVWRSASLFRSLSLLLCMILAFEVFRLLLSGFWCGWESLHDGLTRRIFLHDLEVAVIIQMVLFPFLHFAKRL